VIFAIPKGVLQATLILLQTQSDKTDTTVCHKKFKNNFSLGGHTMSGKTRRIWPSQHHCALSNEL